MLIARMAGLEGEFNASMALQLTAPAMGAEGQRTVSLEDRVARLYEELRLPLFRYLLCLNLSPEEGEEIIQETFLRLHRHLHAGKHEGNLRGWIYRVAHNCGANLQKTRRHVTDAPPEMWEAIRESSSDPAPGPEELVLRRERMRRVHEAISNLSDLQRNCLYLRVEGFRYREIAEIVGVTVSTVAGSLRHAMKKLARE